MDKQNRGESPRSCSDASAVVAVVGVGVGVGVGVVAVVVVDVGDVGDGGGDDGGDGDSGVDDDWTEEQSLGEQRQMWRDGCLTSCSILLLYCFVHSTTKSFFDPSLYNPNLLSQDSRQFMRTVYQIDTNDVQLEKTCVLKRPKNTPKVLDPTPLDRFLLILSYGQNIQIWGWLVSSAIPDNAMPPHESRDPNQPIANFRCNSVAPEEARFSGLPPLKSLSVIISTETGIIKKETNDRNCPFFVRVPVCSQTSPWRMQVTLQQVKLLSLDVNVRITKFEKNYVTHTPNPTSSEKLMVRIIPNLRLIEVELQTKVGFPARAIFSKPKVSLGKLDYKIKSKANGQKPREEKRQQQQQQQQQPEEEISERRLPSTMYPIFLRVRRQSAQLRTLPNIKFLAFTPRSAIRSERCCIVMQMVSKWERKTCKISRFTDNEIAEMQMYNGNVTEEKISEIVPDLKVQSLCTKIHLIEESYFGLIYFAINEDALTCSKDLSVECAFTSISDRDITYYPPCNVDTVITPKTQDRTRAAAAAYQKNAKIPRMCGGFERFSSWARDADHNVIINITRITNLFRVRESVSTSSQHKTPFRCLKPALGSGIYGLLIVRFFSRFDSTRCSLVSRQFYISPENLKELENLNTQAWNAPFTVQVLGHPNTRTTVPVTVRVTILVLITATASKYQDRVKDHPRRVAPTMPGTDDTTQSGTPCSAGWLANKLLKGHPLQVTSEYYGGSRTGRESTAKEEKGEKQMEEMSPMFDTGEDSLENGEKGETNLERRLYCKRETKVEIGKDEMDDLRDCWKIIPRTFMDYRIIGGS
ncbi:hypothetical protein WN51_12955 [Melipona quadrifasciata]|uniref:Uncharacterized protein n=1 Tax=Melipona quadrifasciata TaxID=166423 RepID=A0A0N0BKG6_9HYME|nr:hypothetical protein WN51_12955 [Melipona quadrifasciata]